MTGELAAEQEAEAALEAGIEVEAAEVEEVEERENPDWYTEDQ